VTGTSGPTADVCVVGAGPAGLSLARALTGDGARVVLLEEGDETPRFRADVRLTGDDPYTTADHVGQTRAAFLGGTSGIWSYRMTDDDPEAGPRGCRYAPLDPIDFEARSEIPYSGWPFTRADLDPWYEQAQDACGLGRYDYAPTGWSTPDARPLDLDPDVVETQMFQFGSAVHWSRDVVGRLRASGDVEIVTGAAVTELVTDGAGTVTAVAYRRPDGSAGEVRARRVVLAAGGIENSRLLLMGAAGARGELGNAGDAVGRYWMEHPQIRGGLLVTPPGAGLARRLALYDADWRDGTKVMGKLSITPQTVRKEGLISTSALFIPREDVHLAPAVQAFGALRSPSGRTAPPSTRVRLAVTAGRGAGDLLAARRIFATQTGVDHNGWSRHADAGRYRVFELLHQSEQTPDPDNRITLGTERDRLGRPVPQLTWRLSEDDAIRVAQARDTYVRVLEEAGTGTVIQRDWDRGRPRMVGGNHHHMGGTRIGADPRTGVVDADLKVHGVRNLYVAGSSVFPTGGSVNPTLTVVALSLRLAAHLRATRAG
jgi:choline dehydrogenase-like flavoprotein